MNTPDTPTPRTDAMQRITFEGCTCIVAAPEDIEQLERELTAAKEELAAAKELLSATQTECLARANDLNHGAYREIVLEDTIALLRKRVETADGLAEEAQILANILRANTDVHGRCLLERDMTIGLRAALLTFRATEGKK